MSAIILKFPPRGPFTVYVEHERDGDGWMAIARSHAWLHGSFAAAHQDARDIARGYGVAVVSSAGMRAP